MFPFESETWNRPSSISAWKGCLEFSALLHRDLRLEANVVCVYVEDVRLASFECNRNVVPQLLLDVDNEELFGLVVFCHFCGRSDVEGVVFMAFLRCILFRVCGGIC